VDVHTNHGAGLAVTNASLHVGMKGREAEEVEEKLVSRAQLFHLVSIMSIILVPVHRVKVAQLCLLLHTIQDKPGGQAIPSTQLQDHSGLENLDGSGQQYLTVNRQPPMAILRDMTCQTLADAVNTVVG